jgi:hypothetical protein
MTYIFRVMTQFRASIEPTPPISFSIFSLLTGNAQEQGVVGLKCVWLDDPNREFIQTFGKVSIGAEGKKQLHLRLEDVRFPGFGIYEFQLQIDNEVVARLSIRMLVKN